MRLPNQFRLPLIGAIVFLALLSVSTLLAQTSLEPIFAEARTHEKQGDYVGAEQQYQQALKVAPDNLEALKRLGVVQQTELKFGESIESFQRILHSDPRYPQVNFFLGVSYYGLGDVAKGIASLKEELSTPNPHPRTHFYLATLLEASGETAAAIQQLQESLAIKADDPDALYQLAKLHKDASFQAMDRLKSLDPDSFHVHLLLGELYSEEDRYPEAIRQFEAALQKRPGTPGIHYSIGVANWSQRLYDAAEKEFHLALEENPRDGLTHLYLGDIAVRAGKYSEALPYLENAQRALPNMSQVHLLMGRCALGQGHYENARDELLTAIQEDPSAAQPHYLLAQVYRKLNNLTGSTGEIAKYEELSKSEPETTQLQKIGSDQ